MANGKRWLVVATAIAAGAAAVPIVTQAQASLDPADISAACSARLADSRPLTSAQKTWLKTCRDALAEPSPSPIPSASSTPSPTLSPSESVSPSPTPPAGCALPAYPKPSCTGVPAGTVLSDLPGGYTITTPGAVLDGQHVLGDLFIKADNVVVKNSLIDGNVFNTDIGAVYEPYTITDSTVGTSGTCITSPGIGWANYTATRVQIIGHDDGFRVDRPGNVTIADSFVRLCQQLGSHSGGIQFDCPDPVVCDHVHFLHNTVVDGGGDANSSYTAQSFVGNEIGGDIVVRDSLLMGGGYVMWPWWWSTHGAANWEIHDNRVVDHSWAYAPVDANGSCAHQNWSGNSIVTIDADYNVTSTVAALDCIN